MLDPAAIRFARTLYRLWRLRRWQKRLRAKKAEAARIKALYSLPEPKYWPGQVRVEMHDGRSAPSHVIEAMVRAGIIGVDHKTVLEDSVRAALLSTGLGSTVTEDYQSDGYRVTVSRGKHSVTMLVAARTVTPTTGFAVAKSLFARLEDIASKVRADTPVHVHQPPLR